MQSLLNTVSSSQTAQEGQDNKKAFNYSFNDSFQQL
jgi:hypothetical protein